MPIHPVRRSPTLLLAALASSAASDPGILAAQQPAPAPPPLSATYRQPTIALAQPPGGGTLPQDKPVVVIRFAHGEPGDPLDLTSFRLTLDGEERTALFHVGAAEAWGPLAAPEDGEPLAAGPHQLRARICSERGACASLAASIAVVPDPTAPAEPAATSGKSRRDGLLELLLDAARKLLLP